MDEPILGSTSNGVPTTVLLTPQSSNRARSQPFRQRVWLKNGFNSEKHHHRHRYSGWRLGVHVGLWLSFLVLTGNLVLLTWGITHDGPDSRIRTLATGTPSTVSAISTSYHILINVLATVILSASNYCMQVLSSPTREDIKRAHRQGRVMDVGLMSVRNLWQISKLRVCLWGLLLFSSVPLHLFYNSTISDVTSGSVYLLTVTQSNLTETSGASDLHYWHNNDWYRTYSTQYVSRYGNLTLHVDAVTFGIGTNLGDGSFGFSTTPNASIYGHVNQLSMPLFLYNASHEIYPKINTELELRVEISATNGIRSVLTLDNNGYVTVSNYTFHVAAATSSLKDNGSKVQIALPFMSVVIFCNAIKVLVLLFVLKRLKSQLLVTTGDAIQSFLQNPDLLTSGLCLHSEKQVLSEISTNQGLPHETHIKWSTLTRSSNSEQDQQGLKFRQQSMWPLVILSPSIVGGTILLVVAFLSKDNPNVDRHKWGTNSQLTVNFGMASVNSVGIIYNTWLSNMPQVALSSVYFFLNRLLTRLASDKEWKQWATNRKYLRVSEPEGYQRSTHFLQLPYKIAIPMMIYSGILHWLLSQTIFLRRLESRELDGQIIADSSLCTVGYSPVSGLVFVVMVVIGACAVLALCWIRASPNEMPDGANSSIVISAACHPPPDDIDAHLKSLQWGTVRSRFPNTTVQHCTFTSEEVTAIDPEKEYA